MTTSTLESRPNKDAEPRLDGLADQIQSKLNGRVSDFRVHLQNEGLVLFGLASTFHAKQLALHYTLEATDLRILANRIEVK